MNPIRQIIEDAPDSIPIPKALQHHKIELIIWPLEQESAMIIVPANRFPSASRQRLQNDRKPLKIIILMDFDPDIPRSCPLPWPKR